MASSEQVEQLSRLLDAGGPTFGIDPEVTGLLRLARDCQGLALAGPAPEQRVRLAARFEAARERRGFFAGLPLLQRPGLAQRLAAAALVAGLAGGGASYATGVTPAEAATGTASFVHSLVVNLDPRNSGSPESAITPSPTAQTPDPSASPAATTTPTPPTVASSPGAAATVSPTVDDDDDSDDDERDNSGSGGDSSEDDDDRTRTPEPGDDNGGERQ